MRAGDFQSAGAEKGRAEAAESGGCARSVRVESWPWRETIVSGKSMLIRGIETRTPQNVGRPRSGATPWWMFITLSLLSLMAGVGLAKFFLKPARPPRPAIIAQLPDCRQVQGDVDQEQCFEYWLAQVSKLQPFERHGVLAYYGITLGEYRTAILGLAPFVCQNQPARCE